MRRRGPAALLAALAALLCPVAAAPLAAAPDPDAGVRLNQVQVVGSHNSYHLEPPPAEKRVRMLVAGEGEQALEYTHAPLGTQFATQGVRQIELDVFADPRGGRYANPLLRFLAGGGPHDSAMNAPGTKVLHIQDIDYHSNCLTLVRCLREVEGWSEANPGHVPLAVQLEFKDQPLAGDLLGLGALLGINPLPWTAERMDAVDAEIRSVFPAERIITPDSVRGSRDTLEQAVLQDGWPTLAASRGKVLFLMDNTGAYRERYLAGHPSLRGRVLFTASAPGQPDAAFIKENDPLGANLARIQDEARRGYIVRTRADSDTDEARRNDTTMRDAALASGAQYVSTDYPAPGIAARFGGSPYVVSLPQPARCNPINAPAGCVDSGLELPAQ